MRNETPAPPHLFLSLLLLLLQALREGGEEELGGALDGEAVAGGDLVGGGLSWFNWLVGGGQEERTSHLLQSTHTAREPSATATCARKNTHQHAHRDQRLEAAVRVPVVHPVEQLQQPAAHVPGDAAHHSEIVVDEAPAVGGVDGDVAGVGVGLKRRSKTAVGQGAVA